jgi:hypothetical protein
MNKIVDIADLDCIYLSYDEPQKEEFWLKIKNMVPWAKRVDGIKGSDAAHKAAAEISDTERFILIDGDNMPYEDFFNLQLDFSEKEEVYEKAQYRWKAINTINGLCYGNGGISSWTKDYVMNMKTHEAQTDGDFSRITDFCLNSNDNLYWAMHDCYSNTYPNFSSFQAWRAGFREGVKMCLVQGMKPSIQEFKETIAKRNLNNLSVWHNIGSDVENGLYAILGARYGTYKTMLTEWDFTQVQWFDNYQSLYDEFKNLSQDEVLKLIQDFGTSLNDTLNLPMCLFNKEQSKFFKQQLNHNKYNKGILVKEMDVIRKLEGW